MNSISGIPQKRSHEEINHIFAQLDPQDVEQFYAGYQLWVLQQQMEELHQRIGDVQAQIAYHHTEMQRLAPTPIALASLARLQSHGVSDIDLLDHLFERGEAWLDQTMQRLAYCEQMNFIHDENYTEWCEHALEGAFDWIGSIQLYDVSAPPLFPLSKIPEEQNADNAELPPSTEEMLLHKLMSDGVLEDESTLRLASVLQEDDQPSHSTPVAPELEAVETKETVPELEAVETKESIPTVANEISVLSEEVNVDVEQAEIAQQIVSEQDKQHTADVPQNSWVQSPKKNAPERKRNVFQWVIYILFGK
jgi:hypothetical protein